MLLSASYTNHSLRVYAETFVLELMLLSGSYTNDTLRVYTETADRVDAT